MIDRNLISQEDWDRIERLVNGECSDDDVRALEELLRGNPEAQKLMLEYCQLHLDLSMDVRAETASNMLLQQVVTAPQPSIPAPSRLPEDTSGFGQSPATQLPFFGSHWFGLNYPVLLLTLGGLLVMVGGLVGWLLRGSDSRSIATVTTEPRLTPVAYLTSANGCNWGGATPHFSLLDGRVQSGDEIVLYEGIADFRLASGVSLSIEGPASFVMASPNSLVLQQGKVIAHVPWKAADFQVLVGPSHLTAIDAEFGVQAKGSSIQIHVFSGEVLAYRSPCPIRESDAVAYMGEVEDDNLKAESQPIRVAQSSAVELVTDAQGNTAVRHLPVDAQQFAAKNTMAIKLPVTADYVEMVKKSSPIGYWRFEAVENHQIRNEISTGCPLSVTTDLTLRGDATNRVLEMTDVFEKDNLVSTEAMDQYLNSDFTIELWMKPSHYHLGTLVSLMNKSYPPDGLSPEEYEAAKAYCGYGYRLETVPDFGPNAGKMRSLIFNPSNLKTKSVNLVQEQDLYKVRQWQHVVVVRGSWGMHLYLNGERVAAAKTLRKAALAPGQHLAVGRIQPFREGRPFIGQLDELAIYDRILAPQEIAEHYRAVKDSSPKDSTAKNHVSTENRDVNQSEDKNTNNTEDRS